MFLLRSRQCLVLLFMLSPLCARAASAPTSGEDVNAANNPLTPKITITFHDQWAPQAGVAVLAIAPWAWGIGGALGAGVGKVAHDGTSQPQFQMFMGVNLQFPLGKWNGGSRNPLTGLRAPAQNRGSGSTTRNGGVSPMVRGSFTLRRGEDLV